MTAPTEALPAGHTEPPVAAAAAPATERWAELAETYVPGVTDSRGWDRLAAAIDRMDAAGVDVAVVLPAAVAQAPLPVNRPAPELTYRLYDNEPTSMPTLTGEQAAAARAAREQATEESLATSIDEDRRPTMGQGIER